MQEQHDAETKTRQLEINRAVVVDALKAACLIKSWVRSAKSDPRRSEFADDDMAIDMYGWELVESLTRGHPGRYDEVQSSEDLLTILDALSVSLFLSSEKEEYFAIRRELNKIKLWLKEAYGVDSGDPLRPSATDGNGADSSYQELQMIVKYLPELKQGWSEARADGIQDYLTVLSLGMNQKRGGT
ncbi:MAG: hypothetical protein ACYC99_04685 [Candidatus Geothermincolia bacterium]